jgi:hypothetical protein
MRIAAPIVSIVAPIAALACVALLPAAARAEEDRDYCTDRPGIGTPACTMAPGTYSVELGLGDWSLNRDAGDRDDVIETGDVLVRYGVAEHAEVQIGWTALGFARHRDGATGSVDHRSGTGDVTVALRRNLLNPDGSGLSIAVMPYVTAPVGRSPIGDGDWAGGVLVPVSYELSDTWSLATTSEVDAAVDEDGHGRHFAASETVGASFKLNDKLTATAEYQFTLDRDPASHHTEHLSGLSLGWQPAADLQFDLGANAGLDHDANDLEVYFGVSHRF